MGIPQGLSDQREPIKLQIEAGFFTESSARGAARRWKTGDKVRFKNSLPEKMGGWIEQELTGDAHTGVARAAHEWTSLDGESWIAYGTNTKLYLLNRNIRYDITPIRRSIGLTDPFTTTNGSPFVQVTDVGHGAGVGDAVRFSGGTPGDAFFNNTVLSVHCNGSPGDTTFVDTSNAAHALTAGGDAAVSSTQIKFGTGALNTTTGSITSPDHVDFDFSTGDWTIETWMYQTDTAAAKELIRKHNFTSIFAYSFYMNGGLLHVEGARGDGTTAYSLDSVTPVAANQWVHCAVTRSGDVVRLFIDGVIKSQITLAPGFTTLGDNNGDLRLGGQAAFGDVWFDDFRMTKGAADFTPPESENSDAQSSAVAGLMLDGEYLVTAVLGDTYTIDAGSPAVSSTTGGGLVQAEYDIGIGAPSKTLALGYGVCLYGESTYGTARDIACSGIVRDLRIWSLDNFGEDLIASPRGGALYHWDRTTGPSSRAIQLSSAPPTNERVLVSNSGVQIICLGAFDEVANNPDPMFIRVGAVGSLTEFTLDEEGQNTVFEERLAVGSKIVTGKRTRAGILVGTDKADYIMQDDAQDIFRVFKIAEGNTPIAPNAAVEVDGIAYYMAPFKFMRFDGVLDEIPCEVWQRVFAETIDDEPNPDVINRQQSDKVYCWYNEKFSEIWWFYPSAAGGGENDRYVIFNTDEKCWYFGTIERTAAASKGPAYNLPTAFNASGTFYLHETGVDDADEPMSASIESHDIQMGEGKNKMQITKTVPDMVRFAGTVLLYLKAKRYPRDENYVEKGPYTITTSTRAKGVNITGRQVAVRMESTGLGDDWRMDAWTFYGQPDAEDS